MSRDSTMHILPRAVLAIVALISRTATAQSAPAKIPTSVAQAVFLELPMMGAPQYFDGRVPPGWPAELIPAPARIVGGGIVGDSEMFRMTTAVFEFSDRRSHVDAIGDLLAKAGYTRHVQERPHEGGFASSLEPPGPETHYCRGSSMAAFGAVDSLQFPGVIAVHVIEGEAGRQGCAAATARAGSRLPVAVPSLTPPSGVLAVGSGSSWSGTTGVLHSTLRTTMSTDSLLAHYARQLVAAGWTADGRPAITSGIAVQRFTFRDGADSWSAALIVLEAGGNRESDLTFSKKE